MANKIVLHSLRGLFLASSLTVGVMGYQACDFDYTPRNADEGTGPFLKVDVQTEQGKSAGIAALTALGAGMILSVRRKYIAAKDQGPSSPAI